MDCRSRVSFLAPLDPPSPPCGAISRIFLNLFVSCFEHVVECLRWYSYRWLIEHYHSEKYRVGKHALGTGDWEMAT